MPSPRESTSRFPVPAGVSSPFSPSYMDVNELGVGITPGFDYNLNFATEDTAKQLAGLFGGTSVFSSPGTIPGGGQIPGEWQIDLGGGNVLNAGVLASQYAKDPAGSFRSVADQIAALSGGSWTPPGGEPLRAPQTEVFTDTGQPVTQYGFGTNPNVPAPTAPFQGTPPVAGSPVVPPTGQPGVPPTNVPMDQNQFVNWLSSLYQSPSGVPGGPGGVTPTPLQTSAITPSGTAPGTPDTSGVEYSAADQWLADLAPDVGYLQGIASGAGYPTDVTPAWQSMLESQQENIDRTAADLNEYFNVSGNRFSSSFGKGMSDFYEQTTRDQNAMLGQMTLQSQEAARNRELAAASGLASGSYGGVSQLSSQAFQSTMTRMNQQFQAASQMYGTQEAARQTAAQTLASLGAQGAMALLSGSIAGAENLFGAETQAVFTEIARQLQLQGMTSQMPGELSQLWQQNLQTGAGLGGMQYGLQQDQIDRMYQEYLRTAPEYSPFLPMLYSAATGYPPYYFQQYQPSTFESILSSLSGAMQAGGQIAGAALGGG